MSFLPSHPTTYFGDRAEKKMPLGCLFPPGVAGDSTPHGKLPTPRETQASSGTGHHRFKAPQHQTSTPSTAPPEHTRPNCGGPLLHPSYLICSQLIELQWPRRNGMKAPRPLSPTRFRSLCEHRCCCSDVIWPRYYGKRRVSDTRTNLPTLPGHRHATHGPES